MNINKTETNMREVSKMWYKTKNVYLAQVLYFIDALSMNILQVVVRLYLRVNLRDFTYKIFTCELRIYKWELYWQKRLARRYFIQPNMVAWSGRKRGG